MVRRASRWRPTLHHEYYLSVAKNDPIKGDTENTQAIAKEGSSIMNVVMTTDSDEAEAMIIESTYLKIDRSSLNLDGVTISDGSNGTEIG